MIKQTLVINLHSFIDVITNSSTEIFVCNTDKSIEQIENILKEMVEDYNKERKSKPDIKYEDIFQSPYIYTQEMLDKGGEHLYDYENKDNIGKLMICGATANSVPYPLWKQINELFNKDISSTNFYDRHCHY